MISYRDATSADAEALWALYTRSFVDTFGHLYSPANLAVFMANKTIAHWRADLSNPAFAVQLAEADGVAAGFAMLGPASMPFDDGGRQAIELRRLYVLKDWHGAGIAKVLMDWTLAEARQRGAQDMWLSVFTENARARRFYARYGFAEIMPYKFMVGDQADEDIICKLVLDA